MFVVAGFLFKFHCFVIILKEFTEKMALKRLNHQWNLLPSDEESFSSENEAHLHCLLKVNSIGLYDDQCRLLFIVMRRKEDV